VTTAINNNQHNQQKPLLGKLRLTSTLLVETGLHIGGGGENLNIGGLDKPVVRDPITRHPYLPGSSIKGKLRSILERLLPNKPLNRKGSRDTYRYESDDLESGFTEVGREQFIAFEGARTCHISRLFGSTGVSCWIPSDIVRSQNLEATGNSKNIEGVECLKAKGRNAPARLIVRDSHLLTTSAEKLKKIDTGLYMTEWKFENGLDRITAAANPRQVERVPAGSEFRFELVYTIEDTIQAIEDLKNLAIAVAILEDDALGGHGSRGYGKVKFQNFQFSYHDIEKYRQIVSGETSFLSPISLVDTSELLSRFSEIQGLLPGS
jgi:CRISPR-associated protein Csm3